DSDQPTNAWRDIAIAGDQTLEQLGRYIIDAFDFDNEHLSSFFMSGKECDIESEYKMQARPEFADDDTGIGDKSAWPRVGAEVLMRDLPLPGKAGKEAFLFLYDYGDEWTFTVRLLERSDAIEPHALYPRIVASLGEPPDQYPFTPDPWGSDDD